MNPGEQRQIHKQEYFLEADAAYSRALSAYEEADLSIASEKVALAQLRDELADMEAEALVNGGHGDKYIQATNADKRNAQLRLALKAWPEYQQKRHEIADQTRLIATIEAARDRAGNEMSLNKRRGDAHIANVQRATAILQAQPSNGHHTAEQRSQRPAPARS